MVGPRSTAILRVEGARRNGNRETVAVVHPAGRPEPRQSCPEAWSSSFERDRYFTYTSSRADSVSSRCR